VWKYIFNNEMKRDIKRQYFVDWTTINIHYLLFISSYLGSIRIKIKLLVKVLIYVVQILNKYITKKSRRSFFISVN